MTRLDQRQKPIQVPSAYSIVLERLKRGIQLGTYPHGEMLPSERALAKELGVSRVTLREALRVLEGEGYLEILRGPTGGSLVLRQKPSRLMLREHLDEFLAVQEFRAVNEVLAAQRAATRASKDDLEQLQQTIEEIRDDPSAFRRADSEFHLLVAEVADCPPLRNAIEEARALMFPQLDLVDYEVVIERATVAHQRILDAIAEGDPKKAGRRMNDHLATTASDIETILGDPD